MKKLAALIVVVVLALAALAWAVPKITGADVVDDSLTGADVDGVDLEPASGGRGRR
jgi:hypothetical protein